LEAPALRVLGLVAVLHRQLVAGGQRQAFVRRAVADQAGGVFVYPLLIPERPVARVDHHVLARKVDAHLVSSNLASLAIAPILIASLSVAGVEPDRLVDLFLCGWRVEAYRSAEPKVAYFPVSDRLPRNEQLWVDFGEEPLERLAAQARAELFPRRYVSKVAEIMSYPLELVLCVLVHPHLG